MRADGKQRQNDDCINEAYEENSSHAALQRILAIPLDRRPESRLRQIDQRHGQLC